MNIKIDITVCRVCLQANPGTNIYTGDILEKFLYTTLVQAEKNDGLPEILCKKCIARLRIAYEFKKQAEASDQHIRGFIQDVNKKFQQVTSSSSIKKESNDNGSGDSFDELDEDMQMLSDEQESIAYSQFEKNLDNDGAKQMLGRDQLVEILGEKNSITKQHRNMYDGPPQNMEVLIVGEEEIELASGIIVEDIDAEDYDVSITADDTEFLEDEFENDALIDGCGQLYESMITENPSTISRNRKHLVKIESIQSSSKDNPENYCERCDKKFSTRTNLTRHLLTHDGLKPYVCNVCGNAFTQNGSLKSHMFIHTGERPFKCTECPKAFTQSKSLVFHMRRHTGEKPFPCDHCGIKFRQKDGLKRHIMAKHTDRKPVQVYNCEICKKILLSKYSLRVHRNRHSTQELIDAQNTKAEDSDGKSDSKGASVKCSKEEGGSKIDEDKELYESEGYDEVYICEFCDQTFTQPDELIHHREMHSEIHDEQKDIESE